MNDNEIDLTEGYFAAISGGILGAIDEVERLNLNDIEELREGLRSIANYIKVNNLSIVCNVRTDPLTKTEAVESSLERRPRTEQEARVEDLLPRMPSKKEEKI